VRACSRERGLIENRRGSRIPIIESEGLEEVACEGYRLSGSRRIA
jgi:hypothetical protein